MGCGEDIPEVVLTQDLPWNWQSFPDYLDSLAQRSYDADIATQIGHAPLRVYVMGQRGADREPSTEADRADMARLAGEARSEEHTSELQSLLRSSYAAFCLIKK